MNKIRKGSDEKSTRWHKRSGGYRRSGTIVEPHKNGPIIRVGPIGWKYKPTPGGL